MFWDWDEIVDIDEIYINLFLVMDVKVLSGIIKRDFDDYI